MKFSMECSICNKQLRFPVTTTTCRHNFCSQCVFVYLKSVKEDEVACGKCKRKLKKDDFREDKSLNEVFRNLEKTRELQSNELSNEKMHLYLEYYQMDKQTTQKVGEPCSERFEFYLPRSTKIEVLRAELKTKLRFKKKKNDAYNIKIMNHKQNKEYFPQTTLGTVAFEYGKFDNLRIYFTICLNAPNRMTVPRMAVKAKSPCGPSPSTSTSLSVAPPKIINELQTTNKKIAMSSPLAERCPTISPTTSANTRLPDGPPLVKPRPPAPPRIISPRSSTVETLSKEDDKKNDKPTLPVEITMSVKPTTHHVLQQRSNSPNKIFDMASVDVNMCLFKTHVHFYGDCVVFEPSLIEAVMKMRALVIDGRRCVFYLTLYGLVLMLEPEDKQIPRVVDSLRNPLEYCLEERPPRTPGAPRCFVQAGRTNWTKDPRWMQVFSVDMAFYGENQKYARLPLVSALPNRTTQKFTPFKVSIIHPYDWPNNIQTIHPFSLHKPTPEENGRKGSPVCQPLSTNVNTVKTTATVPISSTNATQNVNNRKSVDDEPIPEPMPVVSSTSTTPKPFGRVHNSKSITPPPTTPSVTIAKPPLLIIAPTTSSANSNSTAENHFDWSDETRPPALKSMAAEEPTERPAAAVVGGLTFKQLIEQRKQAKQQECKTTQSNNEQPGDRKRRISPETETKPEPMPPKKANNTSVGTPPPALQPMAPAPSNLVPTTVPPGSTVHFVIPSTASSLPPTPVTVMSYPGYPVPSGAPDVTSAMIQNIGAQFKQNPQMAPVMILPSNAAMHPNYGYINTPNGPTPAVISTTPSGKPTYLLPNGMQLVHCSDMPSNFIRMEPPAGYQTGAHFAAGMTPVAMQAVFGRTTNMANNKMMGGQCSQMPRMKSPPMMVTQQQMQMQQHIAAGKQHAFNAEAERVQKERLIKLEEIRRNEIMKKERYKEEREAAMRAIAVLKGEKTTHEHYNNKNTSLSVDTKTTPAVIASLLSTGSKPSPSLAAMPVLSSMSPAAGTSLDIGAGNNTTQMPQLSAETDDGPPMLEAVDSGPPTKKTKPHEADGSQNARCPSLTETPRMKPVSALAEALNNSRTMGPPNPLTMSAVGSFHSGHIPGYVFKPEKTAQKDKDPNYNFNPYGDSKEMQRMKEMLRSSELTRATIKQLMANQPNFGQSQNRFSFINQSAQNRKNVVQSDESRIPPVEKTQPPTMRTAASPSNSMSCFTSIRPPIASISPQPEERPLPLPEVQTVPIRASASTLPTIPNPNVFKITEASTFAPKRSLDNPHPTPPPSTSSESIDFRALANMKGQTLGKTLKETFFNKRKSTDGPRPSVSPSKPTDPSQVLPAIQPSLTASQ